MRFNSKAIVALAVFPLGGIVVFAGMLALLSSPSDYGIRCSRTPVAACEILQTRFLGLIGNSSVIISESNITGAQTLLPHASVGGNRAGADFGVALTLASNASNQTIPVLSYGARSAAESATTRLSAYFNNKAESTVSITDDVTGSVAVKLGAPALVVGLLVILRRWRLRKRAISGG